MVQENAVAIARTSTGATQAQVPYPSLDELKKEAINRALKVTSDKRLAARLLGIGAATFYRWEIELGIRPPDIRSYRRFAAVQGVRVAPQLRQQSGIKTLRELRQGEITRVLRLTDGNARLTAKLLAISKTTASRHAHGQDN